MTESTDDKLTVIEETLRDVLALLAADRTGTIARVHGWPEPTEAQGQEMVGLVVRAMTELVRAMRRSLERPPGRAELDEMLEGIALGVLERVMGPPSQDLVH